MVILVISVLTGLLLFPKDTQYLEKSLWIFVIPSLIATFSLPFFRGYEEKINFRQSAFIAMVSMGGVLLLTAIYSYFRLDVKLILLTVYAVPLSLRYLSIRALFLSHVFKSLPYAFFQSLVGIPFIHIYYPVRYIDVVYFFLISLIGLTSVVVFMAIVNRPFLRDFGIATTDMVRIAFQVLQGKEEGENALEDVFKKNAIKGDIKYSVFSFKSRRGHKAFFLVPCLHPGPIKGIAGSRLTEIVSNELEKKYGMSFTFHGPATHVQNPIKEKDVCLLTRDIDENMRNLNYAPNGSSYITDSSQVTGGAQMFGEGLFLTASFSPQPTEDIEAPVGEIIGQRATNKGYLHMALVDSHNCIQRGALELYYPSKRYKSLFNITNLLMNKVKELERNSIKMGIAADKSFKKVDGIGGEGIKVAVFEVSGKKNAFVLIDGNNMVQGLRESIQEEISDLIDISEIMTSDSHEVNTVLKNYNPVGERMDHDTIKENVRKLTEKAIDDMEQVTTGVFTGEINNFSLMGPISSHRFNAVAETIYQMVPLTMAMTFGIQALATTLIVMFL